MRVRLNTVGYGCRVAQELDRFASHRLAGVLRTEISSGACPPGSRIPSYRQLREAYQVALNTAQAAIRMLAAEGLVDIRPARGAYVRDNTPGGDDRTLRGELADLRAALQRTKDQLGAAESMVAALLSRLRSADGAR